MKTAEDLINEISAALRITRDGRLIALLGELKEFLESSPPAHQDDKAPLEPRAGRLLTREGQLRKNNYMRVYMAKRRAKQKEAKLAIINSTAPDSNRTGADDADSGQNQTSQAPPQDSEAS